MSIVEEKCDSLRTPSYRGPTPIESQRTSRSLLDYRNKQMYEWQMLHYIIFYYNHVITYVFCMNKRLVFDF